MVGDRAFGTGVPVRREDSGPYAGEPAVTTRLRPAEALLHILRDEGVDKVFGNPGTSELPFLDSLVDTPDIEYVLGVHEGPLVAMADGYARATGRCSFVSLHIAAGLANGLIGLLNASRSRTPMVVTAGQQDRRHLVQDPMLSGDLTAIARAGVKHVFEVHRAEDLPLILRRAFSLATQAPAGPVFLSLPMDLLQEDVLVDVPGRSHREPLGAASGVGRAARLLAEARAPVIIAGDGVGRDGAVDALVGLAETVGATVYHQPMHDGLNFPMPHPLHAGMLPAVNERIRELLDPHDVVCVIGCHAFMAHHYSPGPAVPEAAKVVQIDPDPAEIGRNFPVSAGLVGGIAPTLTALSKALSGRVSEARDRISTAADSNRARHASVERAARKARGPAPMDPLAAVHAVAQGLPDNAVVLEEAITSGLRLRSVLRLDTPGSFRHTVGGGLGWGIGASVGLALGDPRRPVVAVLGDGCALFGLQGLWSVARSGVAVTLVVMNNGEYRTLKDTLDSWDSRSTSAGYVGLDLGSPPLDFGKAGAFFGVESARARDTEELTELVARGCASGAPLLIDVPITGHTSKETV